MEDITNHEQLENCIFVKTVLMLMVVAYHSMIFLGGVIGLVFNLLP